MKTDLYTKAILTIIAICLLVVASEKIYDIVVPEAQASTSVWSCSFSPEEGMPSTIATTNKWSYMVFAEYPLNSKHTYLVCGK